MKKLLLVLMLISVFTITAFGLTGTYSPNSLFYKPGFGEYGESAFNEFNTYIDIADAKITDNETASGDENIEDVAGGMFSDNTEVFIDLEYQDSDGTVDATVPVKDEDNMASDSATFLCTQQSIKAYADTLHALQYLKTEIDSKSEIEAIWSLTIPDLTGTPVQYDYGRFIDADTIEGRSYAEMKADLDLEIGTDVQAFDNALASISGLTYVSPSFIKLTANDTYAVRTLNEVKTDLAYQLSDLSDVGDTTPTDKYVLVADGDSWESRALIEADISDLGTTTAMVADKLSVFAATTSAELAGVISDETGTLKLVFADSPTFTTKISTPQITFPASQSASGDANTLDDYEEGTFTVAAVCGTSGTITLYSIIDLLSYTKIGRIVTICGQLAVISVNSPVGSLTITGLPFVNQSGAEYSGRTPVTIYATDLNATATTAMQGYIEEGSTSILIERFVAGGTEDAAEQIRPDTSIYISATYFTD